MLLLYQGLKPSTFYWEFVNVGRKFLVLCCITFLSQFSTYYQILLASVLILFMLRVQLKLQPYKIEENNSIEILATVSSIVTLFSMILLVEEDCPLGFSILATILMFVVNIVFIIQWLFLFMLSCNIKNQKFRTFLKIYAIIVRKRSLIVEQEEDKIAILEKSDKSLSKTKKIRKRIKKKVFRRTTKKKSHPINHLVFSYKDSESIKSNVEYNRPREEMKGRRVLASSMKDQHLDQIMELDEDY